jgi:hypothetical protein
MVDRHPLSGRMVIGVQVFFLRMDWCASYGVREPKRRLPIVGLGGETVRAGVMHALKPSVGVGRKNESGVLD